MNTGVMFSSKTDQWETPQAVFDELNREFDFNLDPCADEENHKCKRFFTAAEDGLKQDWGVQGILQSSIRAGVACLGRKVLPGRLQGQHPGGPSDTGPH